MKVSLIEALKRVTASPRTYSTYSAWRPLTDAEIKQEYEWEYPKVEPVFGDIFPTVEDFVAAAKKGTVVSLSEAADQRIAYRSRVGDLEELKDLVSGYRFPRDVDRIVDGFENDSPIPYPIVLEKKGRRRIMSGNTRLDTAFIMGVAPKVLVVQVPEG